MKFQSREVSYSKDSRRVKDPQETVDSVLEDLDDDLNISISRVGHEIAPSLETAVIDGNRSFFWKSRTASRGKGITSKQSEASAVCEYVERYAGTRFIEENRGKDEDNGNEKKSLEQILPPREESSRCDNPLNSLYPSALGDTCPIEKGRWRDRLYMLLFGPESCGCWKGVSRWEVALGYSGGLDESLKLSAEDDWIDFYSMKDQKMYDLPLDLITVTTNGLASGNCIEEASLHGMLEVIERDEAFRQLPEIDPEVLYENDLVRTEDIPGEIREQFDEEGLDKVMIIHSQSELCPKVHVFQALTICERQDSNIISPDIEVFSGKGASLNPEYALQRSLTETFQALASSKGPEVLDPNPEEEKVSYIDPGQLNDNSSDDLKENIKTVKENLSEKSDIFLREIPSKEFGLSVMKCVISNALGPPIPHISQEFYEEIVEYDPSIIEKQGIKSMRVQN